MKILFLQDYIYSGETTNIRITDLIANELLLKGHSVNFLINSNKKILNKENAYYFTSFKDKELYNIIKKSREENESKIQLVFNILKNKYALINLFYTLIFKKSLIEKEISGNIEKILKDEKFDLIVATVCPHYLAFSLAKSKINAKKVVYMLDPYSTNKTMPYAVSKKREEWLYKNIDKAFITDLILNENQNSKLNKYIDKMHSSSFPMINPVKKINGEVAFFINNKINIVYIGTLYPRVRSPRYLLDILKEIDSSICLHLIGPKGGFSVEFFTNYQNRLKNRLFLKDKVDSDYAINIMQKADILINIGNSVDNQLPSKVFEYISTGKPILNIYKTDNCPSLKYFSKYPLVLNIKEGDFSKETTQKINEFCLNNKNKQIEFSKIEDEFYFATPKFVATELEKVLKEMVNE